MRSLRSFWLAAAIVALAACSTPPTATPARVQTPTASRPHPYAVAYANIGPYRHTQSHAHS